MAVTPYTDRGAVRELLARDGEDPAPGAGTAASLSDDVFDAAINRASARVDSYLGAVYTVPFSAPPNTPVMVVEIVLALAAYDVDLTFREVRDYQSEMNPVYLRYKDAMDLLSQLQKGLAVLPDYEPPDPDPGALDPPGGNEVVAVYNTQLCLADAYPPQRHDIPNQYWNWVL